VISVASAPPTASTMTFARRCASIRFRFHAMVTSLHSPRHRARAVRIAGSPAGLDDAEHRLRRLLAQVVERAAM
jgi:hypothetical protein